jgi:hypothetical protein
MPPWGEKPETHLRAVLRGGRMAAVSKAPVMGKSLLVRAALASIFHDERIHAG